MVCMSRLTIIFLAAFSKRQNGKTVQVNAAHKNLILGTSKNFYYVEIYKTFVKTILNGVSNNDSETKKSLKFERKFNTVVINIRRYAFTIIK